MLPGVAIKPLKRFVDERGFFTEIMRDDWKDILQDNIHQANMSVSYPGIVRAWHKHESGQIDYFLAVSGALKICAFDEETLELDEVVSSGINPQLVRIPGHYWHGFKVVGNEPATLIYFVNKLYNYKEPDEMRRPWNDSTIVPLSINGRTDDPCCNIPWDWFYFPYK
jgi:dTDP-4-dehydrorhamnose 3,5-epimerase